MLNQLSSRFCSLELLIVLFFALGNFACSSTRYIPLRELTSGNTFTATGEYVLGPGDRVGLRIFGNTASVPVDGEYTVSPSGDIGLPLAGFVGANGLTLSELNNQISMQLKPYIKDPKVSLSVVSQGSLRVYLDGEVKAPGSILVTPGTNILQGVSLGGGMGRFANGSFLLIRTSRSGTVNRYKGDIEDLIKGIDRGDSFFLERNDYLYLY